MLETTCDAQVNAESHNHVRSANGVLRTNRHQGDLSNSQSRSSSCMTTTNAPLLSSAILLSASSAEAVNRGLRRSPIMLARSSLRRTRAFTPVRSAATRTARVCPTHPAQQRSLQCFRNPASAAVWRARIYVVDMGANRRRLTAQCLLAELLRFCSVHVEDHRPTLLVYRPRHRHRIMVLLSIWASDTGHDAGGRRVSVAKRHTHMITSTRIGKRNIH